MCDLHRCKKVRTELPEKQSRMVLDCVGRGLNYVYAYLRTKQSKEIAEGVPGSPYYVGIASTPHRPWDPHDVSGTNIAPTVRGSVVILRCFLTRDQAKQWEKHFIRQYGRIGDGTGILRNLTPGGDGGMQKGYKCPPEQVQRRSATRMENICSAYGISTEDWSRLTRGQRNNVRTRYFQGLRGKALLTPPPRRQGTEQQQAAAHRRVEAFCARWGIEDVDAWKAMSKDQRSTVNMRLKAGWTPEQAMSTAIQPDNAGRLKAEETCLRWGLSSVDEWLSLDAGFRKVVLMRLANGWDKQRAFSAPVRQVTRRKRATMAA